MLNKFKMFKEKAIRTFFINRTKNIYKKDALSNFSDDSNVIVLSMLQEKDVQMFCLAIYSFSKYIQINKVVIVCDPTLSLKSRDILKNKINKIDFFEAKDYQCNEIPKGGTWERLHAITTLVDTYYVIQMDADILTIKKPQEVIECIQQNKSFILGANEASEHYKTQKIEASHKVSTLAQKWVKEWKENESMIKIQPRAEAEMEIAAEYGFPLYTRGCSGFAGFAKGSTTPEKLYKLSSIFEHKLGKHWSEWGSEQFSSNLLLSNVKNVIVLPIDKYNSADRYNHKSVLLHFIGFVRFSNLLYLQLAQRIIKR